MTDIIQSSGMEGLEASVSNLEHEAGQSDLWDDPSTAQLTLSNLLDAKSELTTLRSFESKVLRSITLRYIGAFQFHAVDTYFPCILKRFGGYGVHGSNIRFVQMLSLQIEPCRSKFYGDYLLVKITEKLSLQAGLQGHIIFWIPVF